MPSSTPHQKFWFYHLPTWGQAGIKLGGASYVSNVSIIFDCSMIYYLLFWTILGFIFHFYVIFGTNLLIGGPTQNCCFCLFQCFGETEYQTESKRNETFGTRFSHQIRPRRLGPSVKKATRRSRGWRARPLSCGPLGRPPTYFFLLYIPTYPQTNRDGAKNLIPPPQLFVSTRSHLGACSGAPPERAIMTEGFYIIIASPMKCE